LSHAIIRGLEDGVRPAELLQLAEVVECHLDGPAVAVLLAASGSEKLVGEVRPSFARQACSIVSDPAESTEDVVICV
jgi:hypothetical protein